MTEEITSTLTFKNSTEYQMGFNDGLKQNQEEIEMLRSQIQDFQNRLSKSYDLWNKIIDILEHNPKLIDTFAFLDLKNELDKLLKTKCVFKGE